MITMLMMKDHNCRILQPDLPSIPNPTGAFLSPLQHGSQSMNLSQSNERARMSGEVANEFESLSRALVTSCQWRSLEVDQLAIVDETADAGVHDQAAG